MQRITATLGDPIPLALYHTNKINSSKAREALASIISSPRVHLLHLNLSSLASVRACAADFLSQSKQLNIFIANAGIMACPEGRTDSGFETQLGTNHLSHFLLFNLLKDALLASSTTELPSRAVILSSIAHQAAEVNFDNINLEGIYDPWLAYGQSKTCNLWTANEIERRFGGQGLHAFSVHPGGVSLPGAIRFTLQLFELQDGLFSSQSITSQPLISMSHLRDTDQDQG